MAEEVPDVYADNFRIHTNPYGVNLIFAKTHPDTLAGQPQRTLDQVIVRMSLEHLKVMTMVLRKSLRSWESQTGEVNIPFEVLNAAGLSKEDW